jgi:hypothetical protein
VGLAAFLEQNGQLIARAGEGRLYELRLAAQP